MHKKRFMNKKAQFFLIAALIISAVILTFGKTYTSSKIEATPVEVYDLSDQFQYEASQVIDNGLLQEKESELIEADLVDLTSYYASINPDSNIDVIFGNETNLQIISYTQEEGIENIAVEPIEIEPVVESGQFGTASTSDSENTETSGSITESQISHQGGRIKVKLIIDKDTSKERSVENSFDVKSGQNLYIIVRKKVKDQDVVIYR